MAIAAPAVTFSTVAVLKVSVVVSVDLKATQETLQEPKWAAEVSTAVCRPLNTCKGSVDILVPNHKFVEGP